MTRILAHSAAFALWAGVVATIAAPLALPGASRPAHAIPAEIGTPSGNLGRTPTPHWSSVRQVPEPVRGPKGEPAPGAVPVLGVASWYAAPGSVAAAGPALRRALGHWRGQLVTVISRDGNRVTVRLTDWCGCPHGRVIDLSDPAFAVLAPLPVGIVRVTVAPFVAPATDR
jgi:hypothetical protein